MRRVIVRSPGVVEIVEAEVPTPGPGEVRARSRVVGICGSDLHALAGDHPFIDLPYSPGHEVTGIVDALGLARPDQLLGRESSWSPTSSAGSARTACPGVTTCARHCP